MIFSFCLMNFNFSTIEVLAAARFKGNEPFSKTTAHRYEPSFFLSHRASNCK